MPDPLPHSADPDDARPLAPPPPPAEDVEEEEPEGNGTAEKVEHAARASLGLRVRDRAEVYRDTAEAATDNDAAFWVVLLLSGAIATLGLALDATAVVIGAMLVAPLLGPLLGLAMALAVGDGRLAVQTGATVVVGTAGVIALAALLTALLPFQNVTSEIAARTRPTTIDLGIAVASGLAGAVVTLSRESRLSAAIPGVAIAVALIPPMGVAGFALGGGGDFQMFYGSMLLYGANLAGIVLSATAAFLIVGMHRPDVLAAARAWHRENHGRGLAAKLSRLRLFGRLRVFDSPWARIGMVLAFVALLAVPLSSTLGQIVREQRVRQAVDAASGDLTAAGAAVLSREVTLGDGQTAVRLRVAAPEWIGADARRRFETEATARAGEPVSLTLDQVIAADGGLDTLAEQVSSRVGGNPSGASSEPPLAVLEERIAEALAAAILPDSAYALGAALLVGAGPAALRVGYVAPRRLSPDAEAVVAGQVARALGLDAAAVRLDAVLTGPRPLPASPAATAALADTLAWYPALALRVLADSAAVERLTAGGLPRQRLRMGAGGDGPPRFHFVAGE